MPYDYRKEVREDLDNALNDNYEIRDYINAIYDSDSINECDPDDIIADIREDLYNDLWVDDSVTGNGSGSYTFNREEAKQYVLESILTDDTVYEAFDDFCEFERLGKLFAEADFESIDVIVRTALLGETLDNWIDDNRDNLIEIIEEIKKGIDKE